MKLKKKKYINYSGKVYDLKVSNRHHSYTVNGMVVHNSSAGSLVAYLLGLVNINPLDYDLLFSRFLTRGRLIRHEKIEEIIINQEDKDPIRIKSNDFVRIFRGEKEMIVKGNELQEGDNLVDYDNKINQ